MNILSRLRTEKLPVVLIALISAINLSLLFIPLVGKLGYEHAAVNSILIFISSGLLSIRYFRKTSSNGEIPIQIFLDCKTSFLLLITIPFITAFISTILFSSCPFTDGIFFYLAITLPTVLLGSAAGYFSIFISKKYSYIIFVCIVLLFPLVAFIEIYFNPQIYFYNPLIGFTPGTIYDEDLSVELPLILYRLINTIFAVCVFSFLPRFMNKRKFIKAAAVLTVFLSVFIFINIKPVLGYSTNENRLIKNLPRKTVTEHFNIYSTVKDERELSRIALLHEYYYEQVMNELKLDKTEKINSFIFENAAQKRKLFGSGNADVAKTWSNQIFLNYDSFEKSLKHELVHILSGYFGATIFKISDGFNMAMVEGIAMAVDNNFDGYPVHYGAKLAIQLNGNIKVSRLFSGLNFFTQYSAISYIVAGSFVKFLIDNYGVVKIKQLYGDFDFDKVFGKNIIELEKDYYEFMKSVKIDSNMNKSILYFGGQPIFQKFCPRTAAAQTKNASVLYNENKYKEAYEIYNDVYTYSGSFQSLSGSVNSLIKLKRYNEAEDFLKDEINKFRRTRFYFTLEVLLSEVYALNNKPNEAQKYFDSLLVQNPHIIYSNNILTKKEFLKQGTDSLKKYLIAETKDKYEMLLRLNLDSVRSFTVPALINTSSDSTQMKNIVELLKNKIDAADFQRSYALLNLSEVCEKIGNYSLAKEYAVKALVYKKDEYFTMTLSENLKRINWFNNFSQDIKPFLIYR